MKEIENQLRQVGTYLYSRKITESYNRYEITAFYAEEYVLYVMPWKIDTKPYDLTVKGVSVLCKTFDEVLKIIKENI